MRVFLWALALAMLAGMPTTASAGVLRVEITLATQTMRVSLDGTQKYVWSVSTARRGHVTPRGSYHPYWLDADHRSRKYGGAPMPNSIFYSGSYAIHGTPFVKYLGRPASHGCVRLHPANAKILYGLVQQVGYKNTHITIQ